MKRISTLFIGFATLTGCFNEPHTCTAEERSSVTVDLVDPEGNPIEGASVEFLWEDIIEDCSDLGGGAYICGWEQGGEITVFADAEGYEPNEAILEVASDECHVITETLEITLETIDCTTEVVTSVEVEVSDNDFPIEGAEVAWSYQDTDMLPILCEEAGGGIYHCGEEAEGALEITVQHESRVAYEVVEVGADECHVITEFILIDLGLIED